MMSAKVVVTSMWQLQRRISPFPLTSEILIYIHPPTAMRSPLLSVFPWRDAIDAFCESCAPDSHTTHHTETAIYVKSDEVPPSRWRGVANWLSGKPFEPLDLSKPIHFVAFRWCEKVEHYHVAHMMTREAFVETLRKLADRWDEVALLYDDLEDARERSEGNDSIPKELVDLSKTLSDALGHVFHRQTEFMRVLGGEIMLLADMEAQSRELYRWRVHPYNVTLESLVATVDEEQDANHTHKRYILPSYPDSTDRGWSDARSDWMFRVINLLSEHWTEWCQEYDVVPPDLLQDVRSTLDKWRLLLPEPPPSERVARALRRYRLDEPMSSDDVRRFAEFRRKTARAEWELYWRHRHEEIVGYRGP